MSARFVALFGAFGGVTGLFGACILTYNTCSEKEHVLGNQIGKTVKVTFTIIFFVLALNLETNSFVWNQN